MKKFLTVSRSVLAGFMLGVLLLGLSACATTRFDLSAVKVPIVANQVRQQGEVVSSFSVRKKSILWLHGLLGETVPDVAGVVAEAARGYDQVVNFRVNQAPRFGDWLATHLTLGVMRMKTVVIEGELVRGER
jgi:hypothetical protein